jgi:hypothetical protein
VKAPKIFFVDNGLRNFVAKNFQPLQDRSDKGALNENFVASELIKRDIELKYWRTKAKAEVDFIVEAGGKIVPIEVKSSLKDARITRSFNNFLEEYKPKSAFVLSDAYSGNKAINGTSVHFSPLFRAGAVADEIVG